MKRVLFGSEEDRRVAIRVAIILATPLAFIVLVPSTLGLWLVHREAQDRSRQNRALILAQQRSQDVDRELQTLVVDLACVVIRNGSPSASDFKIILKRIERTCG